MATTQTHTFAGRRRERREHEKLPTCHSLKKHNVNYYLRQGGYTTAGACLFVCLSKNSSLNLLMFSIPERLLVIATDQ